MKGEMDPFFFLTKHKNFIPHEYPCRTDFAASATAASGPTPRGAFEPTRVWLPFGSPRVDLSGFWFRPTRLGTWARTVIDARRGRHGAVPARAPAAARCCWSTAPRPAGWRPTAAISRTRSEFEVALDAGAERDPRLVRRSRRARRALFLPARLCSPARRRASPLPMPVEGDVADGDGGRARRHAFRAAVLFRRRGRAGVRPSAAAGRASTSTSAIEGDFMSTEEPLRLPTSPLKAGATPARRSPPPSELPADFRHFGVTLTRRRLRRPARVARRRDLPRRPAGRRRRPRSPSAIARDAGRGVRTRRARHGARLRAAGAAAAAGRRPTR